ncbi:flagellar motor protein MotB [Ornithinibacillus scapharcae]|uniref:flagellar motor protein MotB n=1 Tax=Ornithinibacillus scapharcae TaxID=1147159 RepID=UPI000225B423
MRKNKKKHDDQHIDESWLLPYSDLLTLLVALFIVLFSMSTIDAKKFEEMAAVFRSEFGNGDQGIMEQPIPTPETKLPEEEEKEERQDTSDNGATEYMNLQELKEK